MRWPEQDVETVVRMRKQGIAYNIISGAVGRPVKQCKNLMARKHNNSANPTRIGLGLSFDHCNPDPFAVADRDRVLSAVPTLSMLLLGDPLPGRSALDRRVA